MVRTLLKKQYWFIFAFILFLSVPLILIGCGKGSSVEHHHGKTLYQCSMHPQITSDKPENCPICGMRLTRVDQPDSPGHKKSGGKGKILYYQNPMTPAVTSPTPTKDSMGMDYIPVYESDVMGGGEIDIPGHGEVFISPERQQLIGMQTTVAEKKPLTFTIRTVGTVAYDPELYSTFTEYKQAAMSYEKVKENPLPQVRERSEALLHAAEIKLKQVGLSDAQMKELLTGNGDATNLLLPAEKIWVYADIFAYESGLVKPGQKAKITSPAFPKMEYEGEIKTVDAVLNAMTRSLRARIEVEDKEKILKPEMFVDVTVEIPLGTNLAVPEQAVVDAGETKLVFVDKGEGHIEPREVKVGYLASGDYEILSGVSEGEKVVSSANFLIDSESRFRSAAQSFKGAEKKMQPAAEKPVSEMQVTPSENKKMEGPKS